MEHRIWCASLYHEPCNCWCPIQAAEVKRPVCTVVSVSAGADNKIADLEQAMQRMLIASNDIDLQEAYSALNVARKNLYRHIEALELIAGTNQSVHKPF